MDKNEFDNLSINEQLEIVNSESSKGISLNKFAQSMGVTCLLYTSDAADDLLCVDFGGRRIIKKKKKSNPGVGVQIKKKPQAKDKCRSRQPLRHETYRLNGAGRDKQST